MFAWALKLQHITARVPLFQPALPALKVEFELRSEFEREREREKVFEFEMATRKSKLVMARVIARALLYER